MSELIKDQVNEIQKESDDLNMEGESILDPMTSEGNYPSAELSKSVTPELETLEPIECDAQVNVNHIEYDEQQTTAELTNGVTDDHRLFFKGMGNSRDRKNSYLLYFYILGAMSLLVALLSGYSSGSLRFDDYLLLVIGIILIGWATIATVIRRKRSADQFVVFDRESGNVLFTARRRWPDLVVPFEKVGMFTEHYMGKGSMVFSVNFDCQMRPKGKKGRRTEMVVPMGPNNADEVISDWAYINRFMDKSSPLP